MDNRVSSGGLSTTSSLLEMWMRCASSWIEYSGQLTTRTESSRRIRGKSGPRRRNGGAPARRDCGASCSSSSFRRLRRQVQHLFAVGSIDYAISCDKDSCDREEANGGGHDPAELPGGRRSRQQQWRSVWSNGNANEGFKREGELTAWQGRIVVCTHVSAYYAIPRVPQYCLALFVLPRS